MSDWQSKFPEKVAIKHSSDGKRRYLYIDGEPFPWHTYGLAFEVDAKGVAHLNVRIVLGVMGETPMWEIVTES